MSGVLVGLGVCEMAYGDNAERRCAWCGRPLEGRRRRWCSDECGSEWFNTHSWTGARATALKRDNYRCVRCGEDPSQHVVQGIYLMRSLLRVGALMGTVDHDVAARGWLAISAARWHATHRLEVNHKTPILGRHAENGCHHHPDGLETLCHACHVVETNRQFGRDLSSASASPVPHPDAPDANETGGDVPAASPPTP